MINRIKIIWEVVTLSFREWSNDNAAQLAAAIAYYTIFSIPPLFIITLTITGYFINTDTAKDQILFQVGNFVGNDTAEFVNSLVGDSIQSSTGPIASLISIFILLAGASGVFYQVQHALNMIWDIPQKRSHGFLRVLKDHFLSFLMVIGIDFLFLVFIILSTVISALIGYTNYETQNMLFPQMINFLLLFVSFTILFAIIFRLVPDKEITWTDVWLGSVVTSLLFMLGRYAIGLYLSLNRSASAFGAAGSLIVLLLWIYYSAQIFLFGAEFTHVYSKKLGSRASV
jgi:membrane protein